jgi:hypothetical protein
MPSCAVPEAARADEPHAVPAEVPDADSPEGTTPQETAADRMIKRAASIYGSNEWDFIMDSFLSEPHLILMIASIVRRYNGKM